MFYFPDNLLEQQLAENQEKIVKINSLLNDVETIYDNYNIFCELNEIVFNTQRTYAKYDYESGMERARNMLTPVFENLHKTPQSYLDIGCGHGFFTRTAYELGCPNACGIDIIESDMWDIHIKETQGAVSFIKEDIGAKSIDSPTYDLVTSFASFEHFEDPKAMLDAMAGYVKERGTLFIRFAPIYNSTDGLHMYRHIHVPWYQHIFSEKVWNMYYKNYDIGSAAIDATILSLPFNKWPAINYFILFTNFKKLKLTSLIPYWNFKDYWFYKLYHRYFPASISMQELMLSGFLVKYKNIGNQYESKI